MIKELVLTEFKWKVKESLESHEWENPAHVQGFTKLGDIRGWKDGVILKFRMIM